MSYTNQSKHVIVESLKTTYPSIKVREENGLPVVLTMAVADWVKTPRYPYQSEAFTERRLTDAHWKRLKSAEMSTDAYLAIVTAALCEGVLYKIDGHARAELWSERYLAKPDQVTVLLFEVDNHKELMRFYNVVQRGTRNFYEQVRLIYQELGVHVKSTRLSRGFIVDALNIAVRGAPRGKQDKRTYREDIDLSETIKRFQPEIEMIDSINPPSDIFYSGTLAAALLTLALDPTRLDFFAKLAGKEGNKVRGRMDPVEAVLRLLDTVRLKKTQAPTQIDLCARTIRAVKAWDAGENDPSYWMKNAVQAVDLRPVILEVKRLKGL